jgi:hypothetical protein
MEVLLVAVVEEDIFVLGSLEPEAALVLVLEGLVTVAIEVAVDVAEEDIGLVH